MKVELFSMRLVCAQSGRPSVNAKQNHSLLDDQYARWARGKPLIAAVALVVAALWSDGARAMSAIVLLLCELCKVVRCFLSWRNF